MGRDLCWLRVLCYLSMFRVGLGSILSSVSGSWGVEEFISLFLVFMTCCFQSLAYVSRFSCA